MVNWVRAFEIFISILSLLPPQQQIKINYLNRESDLKDTLGSTELQSKTKYCFSAVLRFCRVVERSEFPFCHNFKFDVKKKLLSSTEVLEYASWDPQNSGVLERLLHTHQGEYGPGVHIVL